MPTGAPSRRPSFPSTRSTPPAATGNSIRILLDGNEALFDAHGIAVYPTVLFFEGGKVSKRLDGKHLAGLREKQLTDLIASCGKARG